MEPEIQFLNVDLEVISDRNLQPLVDAWENEASNLYCGESGDGTHLATFEIHDEQAVKEDERIGTNSKSDGWLADPLILEFCSLVRNLDGEAKKLWETAQSRTFDLGYERGVTPHYLTSGIKTETIQEIAKIAAAINITFYRIFEETKKDEL